MLLTHVAKDGRRLGEAQLAVDIVGHVRQAEAVRLSVGSRQAQAGSADGKAYRRAGKACVCIGRGRWGVVGMRSVGQGAYLSTLLAIRICKRSAR